MKLEHMNGFDLYLRDETDLWGYYQNGVYEPEETKLIKSLVKPNYICMDVGANIGYFTILMAKQCKYVFAFEPEPTNFKLLRQNIALNHLQNKIDSKMEAVTELNTIVMPLYLCSKSHGMHRTYPSVHCDSSMYCLGVALDDYKYPKIDFIKMDIEGAEMKALRGMVETLVKDKPTIVMEYHPPSIIESGANPKEIYNFLIRLGYEISLVPDIEFFIEYDKLFERTNNVSGGQNILCTIRK